MIGAAIMALGVISLLVAMMFRFFRCHTCGKTAITSTRARGRYCAPCAKKGDRRLLDEIWKS